MKVKGNVYSSYYPVKLFLYKPAYWDENGNEIPLENNTNVTIDWGDGTVESFNSTNMLYKIYNSGEGEYGYAEHTYATTQDDVIISITGECQIMRMHDLDVTEIIQWGELGVINYYFVESDEISKVGSPTVNSFKNIISFDDMLSYTQISEIPNNFFRNCKKIKDFSGVFSGCTNLTKIPENLFKGCENAIDFSYTFSGCTSLTEIPENLFKDCENAEDFSETFKGCTSLTEIPENLFENCKKVEYFEGTFRNCSNLQGNSIPLWNRVPNGEENSYRGTPDGYSCYYGCNQLINFENIPSYWKSYSPPPK